MFTVGLGPPRSALGKTARQRSTVCRLGPGCVGRERADEEIRCQVRGKFGSDADEDIDDMLQDTTWVKLSELTDNIREADLKALDEFTKGLNKAIKDARRRLRQ